MIIHKLYISMNWLLKSSKSTSCSSVWSAVGNSDNSACLLPNHDNWSGFHVPPHSTMMSTTHNSSSGTNSRFVLNFFFCLPCHLHWDSNSTGCSFLKIDTHFSTRVVPFSPSGLLYLIIAWILRGDRHIPHRFCNNKASNLVLQIHQHSWWIFHKVILLLLKLLLRAFKYSQIMAVPHRLWIAVRLLRSKDFIAEELLV